MKSHKKMIAFSLVVAMLAAMVLGGCKGGNDQGSTETQTKETNVVNTENTSDETLSTDESGTSQNTSSTLRVGLQQGNILPASVLVAKAMGYFEEEGLDIEWSETSGGSVSPVSTGNVDIYTAGSLGVWQGISEGDTNVYVAAGLMSEGSDIIALNSFEGELNGPEDFDGLKVAICTGDAGRVHITEYMKEAGDYECEFVLFDSLMPVIEAVSKGETDIGILCGAMSYTAVQTGQIKIIGQVIDFVDTYPCCRLQVSKEMVNERNDELVKFIIAQLRGYQTYLDDKEKTCEILAEYSGQDALTCEAMMYGLDNYHTPMVVTVDPDTQACVATYEKMKKLGFIDENTPYDVKDYIYTDAYKAALETMIEREPENSLWTDLMETFEEKNSL